MIDISRLSPQELDRFLHLQAIIDRQKEAQDTVKELRNYYYGAHPVLLTTRQKEFLGALVNPDQFRFSHNLVRTIIDTLRERLNVIGFTVNGAAAGDLEDDNPTPEAQLAALKWSWWNSNRMDSQQIRLHRRALRDGESYAIVDFSTETGRPRISLHKADDGKTGVTFHRDPTDSNKVLFAARYFYTYDPLKPGTTGMERKTVYLANEIRKYMKRGSGDWEQYRDPEDNDVWPLPWRDNNGQPLGVPVFEFENPGGSEMAQVIGLQNAINKAWLDVIAGADSSGFPLLVTEYMGEGGMPVVDDDDNLEGADEVRMAPGRMIEVDNARVHRIEASSLSPMLEVVWALVAAMAGVARVPQYTLRPAGGNDVPSGEALKMLESGLVKRAQERQLIYGQSWADVMIMCVKVARTFGSENVPELDNADVGVVWASAEVRNEKVDAETAALYKGLGMSDEYVWAKAGVEPEQIAAFKDNARADRAKDVAAIAGALKTNGVNNLPQTNPQAFGNGGQSADASPENLASTQGLNGIQIRAAVELLAQVTNGEIAPSIALELIVSLGIDRAKAEAMVNEAGSFVTVNKPQVPVTNVKNERNTNGTD